MDFSGKRKPCFVCILDPSDTCQRSCFQVSSPFHHHCQGSLIFLSWLIATSQRPYILNIMHKAWQCWIMMWCDSSFSITYFILYFPWLFFDHELTMDFLGERKSCFHWALGPSDTYVKGSAVKSVLPFLIVTKADHVFCHHLLSLQSDIMSLIFCKKSIRMLTLHVNGMGRSGLQEAHSLTPLSLQPLVPRPR